MINQSTELDACGVGFAISRKGVYSHQHLQMGLHALCCVEHRGALGSDNISSDGAGIMTDIPWDLIGYEPGSVAVAMLFMMMGEAKQAEALDTFEKTFKFMGLEVIGYREVPINKEVLGPVALSNVPTIKQAIIKWPAFCRTSHSFDTLLHMAKQKVRTREKEKGIIKQFYFASLSSTTINYKALTKSVDLDKFYLDLQNPKFKTRFSLFHRRFSTNTKTSWDKIQPLRLIAHNGEINTVAGNRSWAYSREQSLGLPIDELLTHTSVSDSGSMNEMVECLTYRSSIPQIEDILAILIPAADKKNAYYKFWGRAMEPWDGPALIAFCNGNTIGARLDRNGFRPCRWTMTDDHFFLSSEAGTFEIDESIITSKGALYAGRGVKVDFNDGSVDFRDPSIARENFEFEFDPRLSHLPVTPHTLSVEDLEKQYLFNYNKEDLDKVLIPMIKEGKEAIGSMGDTARPAYFSQQARSFFDYFYQNFAQVTNPPLDYIREKMVTNMAVYLGRRPNILHAKELIPPVVGIEIESPILSLDQMSYLDSIMDKKPSRSFCIPYKIDITFEASKGKTSFYQRLKYIEEQALYAVNRRYTIIVLSDRSADYENPAIPSLLALRTVVNALNKQGLRLHCSIIVDSGEIRSTHHVACLIGFGATAVCPWLSLATAEHLDDRKLNDMSRNEKSKNLIKAFETGLLKIMSKMGISVVRSYQSAKLFVALGLGSEMIDTYFPGLSSPFGGITVDQLVDRILEFNQHGKEQQESGKLQHSYLYREQPKGIIGEKHSMTSSRSRMIHKIVQKEGLALDDMATYEAYLKEADDVDPINIRHLVELNTAKKSINISEVQTKEEITKTFSSGAMSFGAISAESQRDIFMAMQEIGGTSNSGEGGENPYYYSNGISASVKQVASGRFGVTAEYLISADTYQIKVAQGAKPGEGGQLMGVKVNEDIAKARNCKPGVDLISPPPLHDIYSIEDLKGLIYELKQLNPKAKVDVKLVAGVNIGTIAVGVVKAGADIIHISGYDGGTGAATLSSMKHAGLPFELGLVEVHEALKANNLRQHVSLHVDGNLCTGLDIVKAAILGADGFSFGKLLLIAQGCVMARICEKNTCPTGIATHDPKFKSKYKGTKDHIVKMMHYLAEDVRRHLASIGIKSLEEAKDRKDLLQVNHTLKTYIEEQNFDLSFMLDQGSKPSNDAFTLIHDDPNELNISLVEDSQKALSSGEAVNLKYEIKNVDRAVLSTLAGKIAYTTYYNRRKSLGLDLPELTDELMPVPTTDMNFEFNGSAGQGFGVFLVDHMNVKLYGEANDSVCKTMSGGKMVIKPKASATYPHQDNSIIGNVALYGACGGTLYVNGKAGDRFAVRNSGANAVVEGTGLHACEYMTGGIVVILGTVSHNVGAGMTGGELYLFGDQNENINNDYITNVNMNTQEEEQLKRILDDYVKETSSEICKNILNNWESEKSHFNLYLPKKIAQMRLIENELSV